MKKLLLLGMLLSSLAAVGEEPHSGVIIYDPVMRSPPGQVWLIPTRLLEMPFDTWPQADQNRASASYVYNFQSMVEGVRNSDRNGQCTPGSGIGGQADGMGLGPEVRLSIYQVTGDQTNVLIGEVVGQEAAWNPGTRQIATLIHLKVTQVVQALDPIEVGDVVTFHRPWGTVTIRGATICSYPSEESNDPPSGPFQSTPEQESRKLLILGRLVPGNDLFMRTPGFDVFPIFDGFLHYPSGYTYYRDQKPEKLDAFVASRQRVSP